MKADTGQLYLGFWKLDLRNLPTGYIRHSEIDAQTAKSLVSAARSNSTLRGGSSDDLLAPHRAHELDRHEELCQALATALGITLQLQDFLLVDDDGLTSVFPLGCIQLGLHDRLLIIDCNYEISPDRSKSVIDSLAVAADTIVFHLFEPTSASDE